jgi:hypothetical protein
MFDCIKFLSLARNIVGIHMAITVALLKFAFRSTEPASRKLDVFFTSLKGSFVNQIGGLSLRRKC